MKAKKHPLSISYDGPAALCALWEQKGSGLQPSQIAQTRLALKDFIIAPNTFQPRIDEESRAETQAHIKNLRAHLESLPAILVFPIAGKRYVLDGHCRLEAWHQALLSSSQRAVPIRYFRYVRKGRFQEPATFADAMLAAVDTNAKDKLPLKHSEKLEFAWRLVLWSETQHGCYSTRDVEQVTGISKSTVAKMMQALRDNPKGSEGDPRQESWRNYVRGLRSGDHNDDWREKLIDEWCERFRKHFNGKPTKMPDVFMEAVSRAWPTTDFPRVHRAMGAAWDDEGEGAEDGAERDTGADF